jgi:hypothetical protein
MGAPAQQQSTGSQVYFDPDKQKYYTVEPQSPEQQILTNSPLFSALNQVWGFETNGNRNYLNSPYTTSVANRIPQGTASPYPSTDALFPALNAGLVGSLLQGSQPTGAMYGAGKYLTGTNLLSMPTTTTSESKGK